MRQVRKLVNDDVFDEGRLQHHGAPVEAQSAVWSAAPPSLALVSDENSRLLSYAQPGPPAFHNIWQPLGGPVTIPAHDSPANRVVSVPTVQGLRHSDPEAPVIEADFRQPHIRRRDDQADVAAEVRQRLAADESPWARPLSIPLDAWLSIHGARFLTMARSSLSGVVAGAATCTPPPSNVIWTVFLRRSLRRTSYSMVVSPKRTLLRSLTASSCVGPTPRSGSPDPQAALRCSPHWASVRA